MRPSLRLIRSLMLCLAAVLVPAAESWAQLFRLPPMHPRQVAAAREWSEQLAAELHWLRDNVDREVGGWQGPSLALDTGALALELARFQRTLMTTTSREAVLRQFQRVDRDKRELLSALAPWMRRSPALEFSVARILSIAEQLHFVMDRDDETAAPLRDAVLTQARALENQARELARETRFLSPRDRRLRQFAEAAATVVQDAQQFRRSVEMSPERRLWRRDFVTVELSWDHVHRLLEQHGDLIPPQVRTQALRVGAVHDNLQQILMLLP